MWRNERERIVEVASGRELTRDELLGALRASEVALLGEQHDNPLHHRRRGELIAALGRDTVVLAEQLPRGRRVRWNGSGVLQDLVDAGFDAKGWQWPVHEPLFDAIARSGATLAGANAPGDTIRRIAREGRAALPSELAEAIAAAPLPAAAGAALDADLIEGHCGQLGGARLASMRDAQRARDATMARALQEALRDAHARPVVLVAGNGHVRADYGVATVLAALQPSLRIVTLGFLESDAAAAGQPYRYVWITPAPAGREDPCGGVASRFAASAPR